MPKNILVREVPDNLHAALKKEAKARRQSMNAYLLTLIETHPERKPKNEKR